MKPFFLLLTVFMQLLQTKPLSAQVKVSFQVTLQDGVSKLDIGKLTAEQKKMIGKVYDNGFEVSLDKNQITNSTEITFPISYAFDSSYPLTLKISPNKQDGDQRPKFVPIHKKGDVGVVNLTRDNRFHNNQGQQVKSFFKIPVIKPYQIQVNLDNEQVKKIKNDFPQSVFGINPPAASISEDQFSDLKKIPYIQKIWPNAKSIADLKYVDMARTGDYLLDLEKKGRNDFLSELRIESAEEAFRVLINLFQQYAHYPTERNNPFGKTYGEFYTSLMGISQKKLFSLSQSLNAKNLTEEQKNQIVWIAGKAVIMSRHAGLGWVLSPEIIKKLTYNSQPYQVINFPNDRVDWSLIPSWSSSPSHCYADRVGPRRIDLGLFDLMLQYSQLTRPSESRQDLEDQHWLWTKEAKERIQQNFTCVTISGEKNRCWMRSDFFLIFEHWKNRPQQLSQTISQLWSGSEIPAEVQSFLNNQLPQLLQSPRFGLKAGRYSAQTEAALEIITARLFHNMANGEQGQQGQPGHKTFGEYERSIGRSGLRTLETNQFGGDDESYALHQAFGLFSGDSAPKVLTTAQQVWSARAEEEVNRVKKEGETSVNPILEHVKQFEGVQGPIKYGKGDHFDILISK